MIYLYFLLPFSLIATPVKRSFHFTGTFNVANVNFGSADDGAINRLTNSIKGGTHLYSGWSSLSKNPITVEYNTNVPSATGNFNGIIRFGPDPKCQNIHTMVHEISHTVGIGTTSNWESYYSDNKWTGPLGKQQYEAIDGTSELPMRDAHFIPYMTTCASFKPEFYSVIFKHISIAQALVADVGLVNGIQKQRIYEPHLGDYSESLGTVPNMHHMCRQGIKTITIGSHNGYAGCIKFECNNSSLIVGDENCQGETADGSKVTTIQVKSGDAIDSMKFMDASGNVLAQGGTGKGGRITRTINISDYGNLAGFIGFYHNDGKYKDTLTGFQPTFVSEFNSEPILFENTGSGSQGSSKGPIE
jgi:hypothetical protein